MHSELEQQKLKLTDVKSDMLSVMSLRRRRMSQRTQTALNPTSSVYNTLSDTRCCKASAKYAVRQAEPLKIATHSYCGRTLYFSGPG